MFKQRGGSVSVNGYILLALVALAVIEAIAPRHYMYENHVLRWIALQLIDQCANPAPPTSGVAFHL